MKDITKITNTIKYEEYFKKIINSYLSNYGYDRTKFKVRLYYNNQYIELIRDDVVIDYDNHIWTIFNPLTYNKNILKESNIEYFIYDKLIYGFFKSMKDNIIKICTEDERFK